MQNDELVVLTRVLKISSEIILNQQEFEKSIIRDI